MLLFPSSSFVISLWTFALIMFLFAVRNFVFLPFSLSLSLSLSWEQWFLRVVVNNTPRPISNDSAAVMERQRIQVRSLTSLSSPTATFLFFSSHICCHTNIYVTMITTWQDTAEGMLRVVLFKIFEVAGESLDHIPPVMYEWSLATARQADDRENLYSRVAAMPNVLNLTS
jgi:hypothetical protein